MQSSRQSAVPAHLRKYVVEQDYAAYTEIDHAVWRFVLIQAQARLQHTAHPAYRTGLAATGIDVERIPRIDDMNHKLARFGWGAACVDGFIPPRAFQEFQANRILPIAAEIRSPEHLAYTPAPDILHEAAGHAPILSEPAYAQFVQTFGALASKAFALPADRAVYQAIFTLSQLKERTHSTPAQLDAAARALQSALAAVDELSESARLARLYWWTAEYGLVGSPHNFLLYGAGLLSSLGESHSCQREDVRKLPLSADCVEVDYDITRAQPQLFVARDFLQPLEVLEDVSRSMAHRVGGAAALQVAQRSQELATLTLDSGLSLIGVIREVQNEGITPELVQVSGTPALARDGLLSSARCPSHYVLPLGTLQHGPALSALTEHELSRRTHDGELLLELSSGISIRGLLRQAQLHDGRLELLLLEGCRITTRDGRTFRAPSLYPLALGARVVSVCAGAPPDYFAASPPSLARVPRPRWHDASEQRLLSLFEQAVTAWTKLAGTRLVSVFEHMVDELDRAYPGEWLLRWNLLESLLKVAEGQPLARRLSADLAALEIRHLHQAPIASGLAYLSSIARDSTQPEPSIVGT